MAEIVNLNRVKKARAKAVGDGGRRDDDAPRLDVAPRRGALGGTEDTLERLAGHGVGPECAGAVARSDRFVDVHGHGAGMQTPTSGSSGYARHV